MNLIKFGAIIFIVTAGLAGSYLIVKNSLISSDIDLDRKENFVNQTKNLPQELQGLDMENPIQWVENQSSDKEQSKNIEDVFLDIKNVSLEARKIVENLKKQIGNIAPELTTNALKTATKSQITANINNTNPKNLENLDYLISEMKKIGVKQNINNEKLLEVEKAIRETAATSTDLTAEFYKNVNIKYTNTESNGFFKKLFSILEPILDFIKVSNAGMGLPFGGKVIMAIPCTCSPDVWYVILTPLSPTYATILSYISGTQLYSNYVPVPHTTQNFLGFYEPGVPACWFVCSECCTLAPTWGMITPFVGSSI